MNDASAFRRCLLPVACCLLLGCGRRVALEGIVILDGQPFDDATLLFLPQGTPGEEKPLQRANALTDDAGRFRAKTGDNVGVLPGTYKVTVSKRVRPAGAKPPTTIREAMALMPKMKEVVPAMYRDEKKTPLSIDVPKKGVKDIELVLSGGSGAAK